MPTFKYTAKDADAKTITGKIVADNQGVVVEELRKRQLTIINIAEEKQTKEKTVTGSSKKVKTEDLVIFTRQLSTMVDAGIPIIQAFEALGEQTTNLNFRKVILSMRDDIQLGTSLSAAFAKHPKIFDPLYVNMIKVGETGGVLTTILDRVASYLEKTAQLVRKVKSAMIYPAVVVSMAMIITTILLVKVVPTFASIYDSLGRELPPMTQLLIGISNILRRFILFIIVGMIGLIVGLVQFNKTPQGAFLIDRTKLRLPIFGNLIVKVVISRFSRTLSTLMQSGVPILESLDIVGKSCGNKVVEKIIDEVKEDVRAGEGISMPLSKSEIFPPMVTRMIAIGEKSGQLEKMLTKISEFYDDQVDAAVAGLTTLIEPLIIAFLGTVVGFIVIALFMPILNMAQALQ